LSVLARRLRDSRGVSTVTYALVLPLFILLVFGILEIWRVVAVRQSLYLGTYTAARYLSAESRSWRVSRADQWEPLAAEVARGIVDGELRRNNLIPGGYALTVQATVEPGRRGTDLTHLGWLFTLRVDLSVPGLITLPILNMSTISFVERQVSYVEYLTGQWTPPEEGPPY
jgi:hypothetical protein